MKIKKYLLIALSAIMLCGITPFTMTTCEAADDDVSVCADILEWLYKVEDGKVYRRLYNASTGEWMSDWIYVGLYGQDN